MSKIDYQALREAAEKATCGEWSLEYGEGRFDGDDALIHREAAGYIPICRIEGAHPESGFDEDFQMEQQANAEFIAAANPATVLALLDERERNQQYIKRRDQENEDIALTVGRLRVELEGKDSKIANLTAERDALREGEMGDARHSNTRAAADIYFQLVEECEIPAGGSLVEYVDDMREKLEAAEKRIAELEVLAFNPALLDVISERQRQRAVEGWTSEHDDAYQNSELADAAACYAINAHNQGLSTPAHWPWAPDWWKQSGPRRDLVKAGALILAEIERIDRAAAGKGETS
ncbi:ead/Ea22-like family protein [Escherichia coli]|uniref:ead/Ea22-like family protein n=1 Tax=Escherichia coli TaxID=562 RepID=UPI00201F387D|nr:ead/Ea22-like family protein [Escherichia coli]